MKKLDPALTEFLKRTRRINNGPFTLTSGRHIAFNGQEIAFLDRVGNSSDGYPLAPWEADTLAHEIVAALNISFRMAE